MTAAPPTTPTAVRPPADAARADDRVVDVASAAGNSARILVIRRVITMVMFAGSTLVLARALDVVAFGAYAGALATLQLVIAASDLGFSLVLLRELPGRPPDAARRLRTAVGTMSLWSCGLCGLLLGLAFLRGVDTDSGAALLVFAPGMLVAGLALYRVPFLVLYRTRDLARMDLVLAAFQTAAVISAALLTGSVIVVAAAMTATTALTVMVVAFRGRHLLRDEDELPAPTSRRSLLRVAAPLGVASLLSSLYFSIDLVLLGWLVDEREVGLYAAAVKVLNLLVTVPGTIAPAILPGLAVMIGAERLGAMTGRVWHWIMVAAVPPCLLVAAFPELVMATLFGGPYEEATTVLRLLALAGVGSALATTLNVLLVALDRGIPQLRMNLVVLVLNVAANIVLVPVHGIEAAAAITVATELAVCLAALVLLWGRLDPQPALRATVRPAVAIGFGIGAALLVPVPPGFQLAIAVTLYVLVLVVSGGWPAELRPRSRRSDNAGGSITRHRAHVEPPGRPYNSNLARRPAPSPEPVHHPGDHVTEATAAPAHLDQDNLERADPALVPRDPLGAEATVRTQRPWWRSQLLLLVPFVVAIVVFVIGSTVPTRYTATSLIRVTVFAPAGPTDPTVAAENGIAAQFALLATTPPVLEGAARTLGEPRDALDDAIAAGTDSGRNLITVRASGEDREKVARRADAVANQLVRAANASGQQATARYVAEIQARNRPLDDTITQYRKLVATGPRSLRASRAQALAALLQERQRQQSGTVTSTVASIPTLQVWARAGTPTEDGLSPAIYAFVGFLVAALAVGYAAYVLAIRERARA